MEIGEVVLRPVVSIDGAATVTSAAQMMRRHAVGCLVVTDDGRAIGMVTDRDLVLRALAVGFPLDGRIDGVMTTPIVSVDLQDDVRAAVDAFATHAVRRLVVLEGDQPAGVVSVDQLVSAMADQLGALSRALTAQLVFPHAETEPAVPAVVPQHT